MLQVIYNNLTGDAAAFHSKLFSWQCFIWDSSQIRVIPIYTVKSNNKPKLQVNSLVYNTMYHHNRISLEPGKTVQLEMEWFWSSFQTQKEKLHSNYPESLKSSQFWALVSKE